MATCGTITVVEPFDPSNVTATCDAGGEINVGDTTTIEVRIDNENESSAQYSGTLTVNGQAVDSFTGTVRGGFNAAESFTLSFDTAGQKSIGIEINAEQA